MTDTKNNSGYLPTAITEYYGERCEEFFQGCACCEAWREYDLLVDLSQSQIKAAEAAALKKAAGNPTREECYSAALSRDHSLGLKSQKEKNDAILKAEWWFLAWRHRILALIDDQQSSALDEYVKAKVDEHTSKIVEAFRINMMRLAPEYSHEEFDAAIRAMKE